MRKWLTTNPSLHLSYPRDNESRQSTKLNSKLQHRTQNFPWFSVSFYSAFLVADKVIVTSKHNNDTQHIWGLHSSQFSVTAGPREHTQGWGTTIVLISKEASDYLELDKTKILL